MTTATRQRTGYPDESLAVTSRYSYAEICSTLDAWYEVEARFNAALNALPEDITLPAQLQEALTWLEPVVCPTDGVWHRSGNAEKFPVAKWKKLIKAHERLISQLANVSSQAVPTKEQVLVSVTHCEQQVIKCVARESFSYQGVNVAAGETFYLSKSASKDGYHIVRWDAEMNAWACSCGAHTKAHAHNRAVNTWIATRVVLKSKPEITAPSSGTTNDSYSLPDASLDSDDQPMLDAVLALLDMPEESIDEEANWKEWMNELNSDARKQDAPEEKTARPVDKSMMSAPLNGSRAFSLMR